MRVLMLTDQYPPFIGGIERHVQNLARGLVARGHEVAVATMAAPDMPDFADEDGVRVYRLRATAQRVAGAATPSGRPYAPPFPDPEITVGLRGVIAREQPDAVHGHNWMTRSFLPLKASSGAALVVSLHDYGVVCAKRSLWYRGVECTGPGFSKCLHCAGANYGTARGMATVLGNWTMSPVETSSVDIYLPVSRAVASGNELARRDLPFEVIPNFVPDDIAESADCDHPLLAELPDRYWLFVGTLSRNKGIDVLLEAYAGLADPLPLVLLGPRWPDTPQRLPAGAVAYHDVPHGAVMAAWTRAELGVVPSVFPDPCPTVAIEAMAAGVPIVASRVGGLKDMVVDGVTGRLVPASDHAALGEAISQLHSAAKLRARMGRAARQRAREFMATAVIDSIEAVYSRVAA